MDMPSGLGPPSACAGSAKASGPPYAPSERSRLACSLPSEPDPSAPLVPGVPAVLAADAPAAPGDSTDSLSLSA
eukprot:14581177-Alexandrium_andersonii.AAC.1